MTVLSKFSVAILIVPLSLGAIAWSTAAVAMTAPTGKTSTLELTKQAACPPNTYCPPNNGGPSSTQGSGTR